MLELNEGLDQHTVCVEHERAVVCMLLNLPVIVEPGATLALEGTDLRTQIIGWIVHVSSATHIGMEAIVPCVVEHLLLFILKLLIILVLVLVLLRIVLLTRLIIGRSLLHIHTSIILLIHSVNFLLLV